MFYTLLQQAGPVAGKAGAQNPIVGFLPFILMIAVMYFLMIRPQKKKQKEHQEMIDKLKIHDNVVTSFGVYGKVVNIKADKNIVVIRIDSATNTKMEIQRSAIAGVINETGETKEIQG